VEVVASLSQGRTAAAQCGLFTHKSVPVIFEPHCKSNKNEQIKISSMVQQKKLATCLRDTPTSSFCH